MIPHIFKATLVSISKQVCKFVHTFITQLEFLSQSRVWYPLTIYLIFFKYVFVQCKFVWIVTKLSCIHNSVLCKTAWFTLRLSLCFNLFIPCCVYVKHWSLQSIYKFVFCRQRIQAFMMVFSLILQHALKFLTYEEHSIVWMYHNLSIHLWKNTFIISSYWKLV